MHLITYNSTKWCIILQLLELTNALRCALLYLGNSLNYNYILKETISSENTNIKHFIKQHRHACEP